MKAVTYSSATGISSREWSNEILFWLHTAIVVCGLFMGLVIPFYAVVVLVGLHRLHLLLFDGCVISKIQQANDGLSEKDNFLQQMFARIAGLNLTKKQMSQIDIILATSSIAIAYAAQYSTGRSILEYFIACAFAIMGVYCCLRIRNKNTSTQCTQVCNFVSQSRFSTFYGIKLETIGLAYFLTVLVLEITLQVAFQSEVVANILTLLVLLGSLSSLTFIAIQKRLLQQLCEKCMNVHGTMFFMLGFVIYRILFQTV